MPNMSVNFQKILLPRFDTFGDLVIFEAFIASLREYSPRAKITLLVRSGYEELALLFPPTLNLRWLTVDHEAYVVPTDQSRLDFISVLKDVLAESWDAVVLSSYNRTWLDNTLLELFKDVRTFIIGSHSDALILSSSLRSVVPVAESIHETEKYRIFIEYLTGGSTVVPLPQLVVSQGLAGEGRAELDKMQLEGQSYVACLPAGTHNQKCKVWPLDHYVDVLCWLAETRGLVPIIVGHISEEAIVRALAELLDTRGVNHRVWLGQTGDIPMLGVLLQMAALYVGNDSGPMHIAAALEVPTVGIFGGGHGFRFLPVGKRAIGVAAEIPCYGCHWNCIFGDAPCVRLVEVAHVQEAIGLVLGAEQLDSSLLNVARRLPQALMEIIEKVKCNYCVTS